MMKFVPSHKNIGVNQSGFGSNLWVSFSQHQSAGSYFAMFFVLVCGVLLQHSLLWKLLASAEEVSFEGGS